jgi:2-polyprenyl-6-hydroxyphenyl methylase/3-demethylubiquinone-9 3-methyltransferase
MTLHPLYYESAFQPSYFPELSPAVMAMLPRPQPGTRLLDVGCGNGFWSQKFAELGYSVVGIDPSESGIREARKAWPGIRFEALAATPDFFKQLGEEPFDYVVSLEVVEHLYAPRDWAAGCYSALKPGGRLVVSTPYFGYLKNLVVGLTGRWDKHHLPLWDGGHIKFWSRKTLMELLTGVGFKREGVLFRGVGRSVLQRVPYLWTQMVLSVPK